jgi:hypothetical protein
MAAAVESECSASGCACTVAYELPDHCAVDSGWFGRLESGGGDAGYRWLFDSRAVCSPCTMLWPALRLVAVAFVVACANGELGFHLGAAGSPRHVFVAAEFGVVRNRLCAVPPTVKREAGTTPSRLNEKKHKPSRS